MFGSWIVDLLVAIAAILTAVYYYYYSTSDKGTWKEKGIPHLKLSDSFKLLYKMITGKVTGQQYYNTLYNEFKDHGYGALDGGSGPILVCKPELIKYFLTKDFNSFHDRGLPYDEKSDPFSGNLVNVGGHRWKFLRAKLSPTFTSGRIKEMLPLILECSEELQECMEEQITKDGNIEMKDLLVRYTTDVIGSCAFGINCNSIKNPNAEFYVMSQEVSKKNRSFAQILRLLVLMVCPKLQMFLSQKRMYSKAITFFTELVDRTVKYRRSNAVQRNDFIQLMMKTMDEDSDNSFNNEVMTAQAFSFFFAGLDNVSMTTGFCLHALAVDQELQDRVLHEISSVLEEYDGKMCYEALGKMDLVSRVLDEGLRLYPPAGVHMRKQTEATYVIPGTSIEITKGTTILVPAQSIHVDEQYFPDPKKFDPDRFTEEEKAKRHPYTYLPFGEGPRMCIAARFAQLQVKLCLAELVRHFNFSVGPKTDILLELDPKSLTPVPKNNFLFQVAAR